MVKKKTYMRRLRQWRGITQQAIADALGVTNSTVSRWEIAPRSMSLGQMEGWAEQVGIDLDDLLRGVLADDRERAKR